jgi:hypothetical protein
MSKAMEARSCASCLMAYPRLLVLMVAGRLFTSLKLDHALLQSVVVFHKLSDIRDQLVKLRLAGVLHLLLLLLF